MEARVIPDIMNHVLFKFQKILKKFVVTCYCKWARRGGRVMKGVLGGLWEFMTQEMEGMVIPDVMNDVFLVLKLHPDHFMHLS